VDATGQVSPGRLSPRVGNDLYHPPHMRGRTLRMAQDAQRRLAEFLRHGQRQGLCRPEPGVVEGLLAADLGRGADVSTACLRCRRRQRCALAGQVSAEGAEADGAAPPRVPARQITELDPADGGLDLGDVPVRPEGLADVAEAGVVVVLVDGFEARAVVRDGSGVAPPWFVVAGVERSRQPCANTSPVSQCHHTGTSNSTNGACCCAP